ncbi:GMC family oxidoreductase N-terminal domain-containing protein, partial [Corallococcus exiguus]|uniref:GMC family oxidoreductase N-terminal domain-containing protein n=1 Tax=Corallococcus exiguus TaxID=83462 RepID=UPI001B8AA113
MHWALLDAVQDAAESIGIPKVLDFNRGDNEGSSYFQVNQKNGRRWSAARGFLVPALRRPNLQLETGVLVERVVVSDGRAVGVEFTRGSERFIAHVACEVVVAAGAVCTPQLLELSGIGQPDRLRDLG